MITRCCLRFSLIVKYYGNDDIQQLNWKMKPRLASQSQQTDAMDFCGHYTEHRHAPPAYVYFSLGLLRTQVCIDFAKVTIKVGPAVINKLSHCLDPEKIYLTLPSSGDVTPNSLVEWCQLLGATWCLHLQGRKDILS